MALGAQIRDVLRMIVVEGMKPVALGLGIGIVGALLLGRVVSKLVFGVKTTDPATFATVSGLLLLVALLAITVPAYRATQVDPMRTLRDE
jgi:ABC-type antimicrobial peptide transport system permease subunit